MLDPRRVNGGLHVPLTTMIYFGEETVMYRHVILAGSIAVTLMSQASNAQPIDRLEEKRPVVAAHLKADAKEHTMHTNRREKTL